VVIRVSDDAVKLVYEECCRGWITAWPWEKLSEETKQYWRDRHARWTADDSLSSENSEPK
jgi:hypothetical protein